MRWGFGIDLLLPRDKKTAPPMYRQGRGQTTFFRTAGAKALFTLAHQAIRNFMTPRYTPIMRPIETLTRLTFTRRELLRWLVMLSAWLPAPVLLAAAVGQAKQAPAAFGPFLDTLLPEDESPSATQLGVDTAIFSTLRKGRGLSPVIELGCAWLDQQASKQGAAGFAQLDEAQRIAVLTLAESSPRGSPQKRFFDTLLRQAMYHYYSTPRAWQSLGYAGPPQPKGFRGHDKPPLRGPG